MVGDSKADQWLPALTTVAEQRGWRLVTYLKNSCPLIRVDLERDGSAYTACRTYNDDRYRAIFADPDIDYVLTSQRHSLAYLGPDASRSERRHAMIDDLEQTWRDLEAAGKQVVVMLDNPSPPHDVMECVAQQPDQLTACAFTRPDATEVGGVAAQVPALEATAGVASVDLSEFICPGGTCPAVIGNVLVYRRGSHLTATYVESLAPRLDEALQRAMSSG